MQQEIWFQKYRILGLLGRGGTANVYLAEHIILNSYRAIKCISKKNPLYDLQRNEAFILKNLRHSGIPIIYDIEEDEEGSYIIEQYLEGDTLKDYIVTKGLLREEIVIRFGIQLCDLIHYLYSIERPILYVDLKPENIIVEGESLKLIDFGSALYCDELSDKQSYFATRGFAAPELYHHNKIDERCDVYGIGMLLYYMVAGSMLSMNKEGITNIDFADQCSKKLKNIINHCLKYHPSQRYTSVTQLKIHLSSLLQIHRCHPESSQIRTIAIAGAQPRIGVTHCAIRMCNYLLQQKIKCLYQEMNDSECIRMIRNCFEKPKEENGITFMKGLPMLQYDCDARTDLAEYQIRILDYGKLSEDNLADFMKAEVKLLILGAKDWEQKFAEAALKLVKEEEITFLFNYTDSKLYHKVIMNMEHKKSFRIPYEPDPFSRVKDNNGKQLFEELLHLRKKRKLSDKVVEFLQKRKAFHEA